MAGPSSLDPFSLVRDAVSQFEKIVNEGAVPLMKSDGFASGANRLMRAALVARKLAQDLTQRYFEALNVPSRRDVMQLGDRLQALEDRVIGLQATLDQLAGPAAHATLPAPPRTRKPPAPVIEAAPAPAVATAPAPKRRRAPKP